MTLNEIQDEIIDDFELFDEWMDKYNWLIELGNRLEPINPKHKNNKNLIEGCQSKVWLHAELDNGKIMFTADSDAIITKGIVALLVKVMSGRKPEEIKDADLYFIDRIGLKENLSPTRSNGLLAMMKQMKLYGLAFYTKLNSSF
ncbi:MAG: SufE family protein [Bacteroidales bacterium]|nr:SufE family protein [Bacteroidales bacterium]